MPFCVCVDLDSVILDDVGRRAKSRQEPVVSSERADDGRREVRDSFLGLKPRFRHSGARDRIRVRTHRKAQITLADPVTEVCVGFVADGKTICVSS